MRPKIEYRARESRFGLAKGLAIDIPGRGPEPEVIHPIQNPTEEIALEGRQSPAKNEEDPVVGSFNDIPRVNIVKAPRKADWGSSRLDSNLGITRRGRIDLIVLDVVSRNAGINQPAFEDEIHWCGICQGVHRLPPL